MASNRNRLLLSTVALVVVQGFSSTVFAGDSVGDSRSARVSFGDLNLSTPQGVEAARERIHQTARRLCTKVADRNDRSRRENFISCVQSAMAGAVPRLEALARLNAASQIAQQTGLNVP